MGILVCALGACGGRAVAPPDGGPTDAAPDAGGNDAVDAAADGSDGGAPGDGASERAPTYFPNSGFAKVDVLVMVDNSTSMEAEQAALAAAFPAFIAELRKVPGGLPDLHIGVVSSSLGAGKFTDVPGCPPDGDKGKLQHTARTMSGECPLPKDNYIHTSEDGSANNFTGDLAEAFSCIAELGVGGCGFEHQMASVARALGGKVGGYTGEAPKENAGFLRDDAMLLVVFITDEDDCSGPVDSDLYDTKQTLLSDPLGPLNSFRCNEFGHLCEGKRPPRTPASMLMDCHSAEEDGKLIPVADMVAFFKTVKPSTAQVFVAVIAGPPEPYSVGLAGNGNPEIQPSCTSKAGSAAPAVRFSDLVADLGAGAMFESVCADTYSPAFAKIASSFHGRAGARCLSDPVRDTDTSTPGLQPACMVWERVPVGGGFMDTPLPACDAAAGPPCWRLVADAADCGKSGWRLDVDRGGAMAPETGGVLALCETCADPDDLRCK